MRAPTLLVGLLLGTGSALALFSQSGADMPGLPSLRGPAACTPCHPEDGVVRWETRRDRPGTPYCLTCHTKEAMAKHHPVGTPITKPPKQGLRLTQDQKLACFTCHDLANHRYDSARWKAESLFSRLFRAEPQYKTYYLATRNDRGQLCLACH